MTSKLDDDILNIAKIVISQSKILNLLTIQLAEQSYLIKFQLPQCQHCGNSPITVEHIKLKIQVCDRCAARIIVKTRNDSEQKVKFDNLVMDENKLGNLDKLGDEDSNWVDLPIADKIRLLVDYLDIIDSNSNKVEIDFSQIH